MAEDGALGLLALRRAVALLAGLRVFVSGAGGAAVVYMKAGKDGVVMFVFALGQVGLLRVFGLEISEISSQPARVGLPIRVWLRGLCCVL